MNNQIDSLSTQNLSSSDILNQIAHKNDEVVCTNLSFRGTQNRVPCFSEIKSGYQKIINKVFEAVGIGAPTILVIAVAYYLATIRRTRHTLFNINC